MPEKIIIKRDHFLLKLFLAGIFIGAVIDPLFAHNSAEKTTNLSTPAESGEIGIEEKLGNIVPLDVPFVTEAGVPVRLRDVIQGPTVLSIVYYKCPNACDFLLTGISSVLRSYSDKPGSEPNLLTITIDERETPLDAMQAKNIAFESIQKPYPSDKWHFLTGSAESIKKVTEAVGFRFARKGGDFDHPIGLIILSPEGKVVRYIMGTDFLPVDLTMSLLEASSGTVRPTIARVLRFCFSYNPKSHQFVFNTLRVSATVIFTLIGIFLIYLIVSGRKRRVKGGS